MAEKALALITRSGRRPVPAVPATPLFEPPTSRAIIGLFLDGKSDVSMACFLGPTRPQRKAHCAGGKSENECDRLGKEPTHISMIVTTPADCTSSTPNESLCSASPTNSIAALERIDMGGVRGTDEHTVNRMCLFNGRMEEVPSPGTDPLLDLPVLLRI